MENKHRIDSKEININVLEERNVAPTADDIGSIHTSVCGRIEFSHNVKHQILIANVCNLTERKLKIGVLGAVQ